MRGPSSARLACRLIVLAGLLLPVLSAAQGGAGGPDRADVTKHPKFRGWINDVPDTGQFLPDSVWLLRVGPRVTTVGDFVERWFNSFAEYRPAADSMGRVQFLNSLTQKDVLGLTALAINRPLDFEDRLQMREARQRALADAVYRRFVRDSVNVSEAEVRALYETYQYDQHLRHILCSDRNEADHVRRQLISGRLSWSAAVAKYSRDTAAGPEGDLGWAVRERMDPLVANAVFALKPGETSQPLQDATGWHIVQSVERKPKEAPPFEPMRVRLETELSSQKTSVYVERVMSLLRAEQGVRYDTTTVRFACAFFGEGTQAEAKGLGTVLNIDARIPEFSAADTARLIATWKNGGRFSIGDLVDAYRHIPPVLRPAINIPEALIGFVEATVLEPKLAEYGARRGLEKEAGVEFAIAKKREELLVQHLYQDSVARFIWVSKDERKAYYQKNLNSFFTYPSVEFAAITRPSKAGADSVQRALRSGVSARALLAADSAGGRISGGIQNRRQNENIPYQKVLFEEMRPGDIRLEGPDRDGDYLVLQLLSFDGGRQLSYEESETMIDESLQNLKAEAALNALLERLERRYEIASRPELVMLVRLADPSLAR